MSKTTYPIRWTAGLAVTVQAGPGWEGQRGPAAHRARGQGNLRPTFQTQECDLVPTLSALDTDGTC